MISHWSQGQTCKQHQATNKREKEQHCLKQRGKKPRSSHPFAYFFGLVEILTQEEALGYVQIIGREQAENESTWNAFVCLCSFACLLALNLFLHWFLPLQWLELLHLVCRVQFLFCPFAFPTLSAASRPVWHHWMTSLNVSQGICFADLRAWYFITLAILASTWRVPAKCLPRVRESSTSFVPCKERPGCETLCRHAHNRSSNLMQAQIWIIYSFVFASSSTFSFLLARWARLKPRIVFADYILISIAYLWMYLT